MRKGQEFRSRPEGTEHYPVRIGHNQIPFKAVRFIQRPYWQRPEAALSNHTSAAPNYLNREGEKFPTCFAKVMCQLYKYMFVYI